MHFDGSRSYKVINVCTTWKPIYDILLLIIVTKALYIATILRHSATKEVENHPTIVWAPNRGTPFEFRRQIYHAKS